MATSLLSPISSTHLTTTTTELTRDSGVSNGLSKSSFLLGTKPLSSVSSFCKPKSRRGFEPVCAKKNPLDYIPKQFRQENLKEGLMENYKNVPQYLYGLSTSQMDMFMTEDSPVHRMSERVTEESISAANSYLASTGVRSLMNSKRPSIYATSTNMYGGGTRGYGRGRSPPPDLPSLLLDARIVFLGMPLVPAVTELIVAQFMWLDFEHSGKPVYLYINSPGTHNENNEIVAGETEAYAIADAMSFCKADIYTVNFGMAYGQAAMLLSLGTKGYRALQPNASTKLYLPKVNRSSGAVTDMWIKGKELDVLTSYYIELLAKGTGKSEEELAEDLKYAKYLDAEAAIEYGVADRIITPEDPTFEKRNYDEILAKTKAMRKGLRGQASPAPSGFR